MAFVAGSVAAMLIALTLFKEEMLEKDLVGGKKTVWWLAMIGVVLAASRSFINEKTTGADDPNMTLLEVAVHTHHYPKHWRGRYENFCIEFMYILMCVEKRDSNLVGIKF